VTCSLSAKSACAGQTFRVKSWRAANGSGTLSGMTLTTSTLDSVIVIWHVAVNNGDADTAAAACTEDVVVGGPKGESAGRDEMRQGVRSAGVRLMPRDCYDVPGGIVVAQDATWTGDATPVQVYSTFGLRDGSISSIHRFATLEEARAYPVAA
jgi:hypothetical protein